MADGGIYAWEPHAEAAAVPFETNPDGDIGAAILAAAPDYSQEIVDIEGRQARYIYGRFDLNGDGRGELLVYLLGSIFCGTGGCNLMLFAQSSQPRTGTSSAEGCLPTPKEVNRSTR